MAGFVDPAFKNIKVTQSNFLIWRISKLAEENYEVKQIRNEYFGNFYDEDSYIVYSCTPVKKVLGRPNRSCGAKMEIHIHLWLGSLISEDECKRAIIKAVELDEVLEGIGTLHKEVQGHESNRFLSYFKKGMCIKKGEIATVLKQTYADVESKLYKLTQRSATLILAELSSVSWEFFNSDCILVLQTRCKLFVWIGSEVSPEEEHLAFQFGKEMEVNNRNRKTVRVLDGKENELTQDDLADFKECLNPISKPVKSETAEDLLLIQSQFRNTTALYNVVVGNSCSTITHVKNGPLHQSDLDIGDICIIDHFKNGVWVWVRKKVSVEGRSRSINIGIAYIEEKREYQLEARKMNVCRVVEGYEPQEFKLLFKTWIDGFSSSSDHYFLKKPGRIVNSKFSAEMLEESLFLAAETQLLDYGGGVMDVLKIDEGRLIPLDPKEFGIFHSSSKYLVCYCYKLKGTVKKVLYYWLGNKLLTEEKEDIWPCIKHLDEFKDTYVRVRIEQYKETPHFYAIFQGQIIVLNSPLPVLKENEMVLDGFPFLIFRVIGGDVLNTLLIEVTSESCSLSSCNVYIVRTKSLNYVWCGARSKGDEREMARRIANKWVREYQVIAEGYESKHFREIMERNNIRTCSIVQEIDPTHVNVPPTLHKCSLSEAGLRVSEIINFDENDLRSYDIIVLDAWDIIFVWTGVDVPEEKSSENTVIVSDYLQSDPRGRALDIPVIHVFQNHEPPIFRGFFPTWTRARKETDIVEIVE